MKAEVAKREIESLDYYLQNHTNDYSEESHTAMMMAIQALEQEPCEDAISRQAALNSLIDNTHLEGLDLAEALDAIENKEKLLPVTPQPKMGQWLSCAEEYGKPVKWVCSSCRHTKSITKNKTEYCPVCGARMGMTDKEIVDKLTELTTGSIDHLNLNDAMDLLCEIKRILSRRDRSE